MEASINHKVFPSHEKTKNSTDRQNRQVFYVFFSIESFTNNVHKIDILSFNITSFHNRLKLYRIHLTIKLAPRKPHKGFQDRNVDDVKDGYVSCDSFQVGRIRCLHGLKSTGLDGPTHTYPFT